MRIVRALLLTLTSAAGALWAQAGDEPVVFRSDVSLVRVDVQALERSGRSLNTLRREDFELFEEGKRLEIKNFSREEIPADVLLLIDVSGSMRPHVERLADAAGQAATVLGNDDRIAVMVFDRGTRTRMQFRPPGDLQSELNHLLRQEGFNGGTDITRALYDATRHIARHARRDARRAIVILTDDRTERDRDEIGIGRELALNNTVVSAILAEDAMFQSRRGGGQWPQQDPIGGTLGGIIFGRRGGYRRGPVVVGPGGGGLQSAGTAEIAEASGGDTMNIEDAGAFEETLARIRQRYALYFNLPPGVQQGEERHIEVRLTAAAQRRHPSTDLQYRRVYVSSGSSPAPVEGATESATGSAAPQEDPPAEVITRRPEYRRDPGASADPQPPPETAPRTERRLPPAQQERKVEILRPDPAEAAKQPAPKKGGWRTVDEPEPDTVPPAKPETQKSKPVLRKNVT